MIPQSFIDDLLQRVDVVDVVGRYVKLKKGGANYVGLCPFHNEKSPSFSVSPTKQFYHCFGCGAHGTAIGFLIEFSGMSFPEAVRDLAQGVGMTVPDVRRTEGGPSGPADDEPASRSVSSALIEALEIASTYYRNALRGSQRAIGYLKGRGLTGEVAARFGLGYAPEGWNALESAFTDYRHPSLVDAGLVVAKDGEEGGGQEKRYDRFRDRVMFPIRNTRGRVIGFGGRILDVGEPKYLNSPETPVFQKGQELYGLFEARQAIRQEGFALVVEGYMDVVALAQSGVENAVATLGTACTPQHVRALVRQTDQITFSFDGDAAGRKAAWRALEAALPLAADDKSFRFLFLPPEDDPDTYVRAHGREAFLREVRQALPLSEYLLRTLRQDNDLATAEGRAKLLFDARPLVKAMPDGGLRLQIVRSLAELGKTDLAEVMHAFQLGRPRAERRGAPPRSERKAPEGLVEQALKSLVMYPVNAAGLLASDLATLCEAAGEARDLVEEIVEAAKGLGAEGDFLAMSDALRESEHAETSERWMQQILAVDENKRDLLLAGADDPDHAGRNQEQREIHARELRNLIRRLELQLIRARLQVLSAEGLRTEESRDEFRRLTERRTRLMAESEE